MTLLVKHICESYSTGESGICVFYLGYKLLDLNFPTSHAIFLPCLASELKENHIHTKWNIKGKKSTSKVDTIARIEKHNPKWGGLGGWHSVLRKLSRERPARASHPVKMLAARTPGPCCPGHHLLSRGGCGSHLAHSTQKLISCGSPRLPGPPALGSCLMAPNL